MSQSDLSRACLVNANLTGAILQEANLTRANLKGANLTNTDLTDVDLQGADLTGAILTGAIGIGARRQEIRFAQRVLTQIKNGRIVLDMKSYRTCIAGLALPDACCPGAEASRLLPTLAKYFFSSDKVAMDALQKVAIGKLSVFPG